MSRRYQLRSFAPSGTRLRGHFTNLDWKTRAHPNAPLHAGFDIEVHDVPSIGSLTTAREVSTVLIAFLKDAGALLPDSETDFLPGQGGEPVGTWLDSLPALPDFG